MPNFSLSNSLCAKLRMDEHGHFMRILGGTRNHKNLMFVVMMMMMVMFCYDGFSVVRL